MKDDSAQSVDPEAYRHGLLYVRPNGRAALVFGAKTATAACLALIAYRSTGLPGETWAPISALIVMQTSLHTSFNASIARFWANLIGAAIGAICALAIPQVLIALAVGIVATGVICHYVNLDDSRRPGFAAVAIVLLTLHGDVLRGAMERVFGVVLGCSVALLVSVVWDAVATQVGPHGAVDAGSNDAE